MTYGKKITFELDGNEIQAREGQTIAEAVLNSGIICLRQTQKKAPRSVFCGMGICYECRMIVDGVPNVRTCMTAVKAGCKVRTQHDGEILDTEAGS